jgi:hypothetical protein
MMKSFARSLRCTAVGLLLPMLMNAASAQTPTSAEQAFERLGTLVGRWEAEVRGGRIQADIRLSAGGTALVETWTLAPSRESLTIYARDGNRLLVTHYCPQGNQPRLRFAEVAADGRYHFAFLDGGNLQDPQAQHLHALWTRFDDANQFTRGELYLPNAATAATGDVAEDTLVFRRLATADASAETNGRPQVRSKPAASTPGSRAD